MRASKNYESEWNRPEAHLQEWRNFPAKIKLSAKSTTDEMLCAIFTILCDKRMDSEGIGHKETESVWNVDILRIYWMERESEETNA